MMRPAQAAPALLLLLLAGCALPEEDASDPLFGLCPQWEPAAGQTAGTVFLEASAPQSNQLVAPAGGAYEMDGHPLDMVRMRIDEAHMPPGQRVAVKVFAEAGNETMQRNWRDQRQVPPQVPALLFTDGGVVGHEYEVFLTSVDHDEAPRAGPIRLEWTLEGEQPAEFTYTLTWHYKVCGIP